MAELLQPTFFLRWEKRKVKENENSYVKRLFLQQEYINKTNGQSVWIDVPVVKQEK